jgi:hypothetical protein
VRVRRAAVLLYASLTYSTVLYIQYMYVCSQWICVRMSQISCLRRFDTDKLPDKPMVMGPGKYEFLNFTRFGGGLQAITVLVIVVVGYISSS